MTSPDIPLLPPSTAGPDDGPEPERSRERSGSSEGEQGELARQFDELRPQLVGAAYRVLSSVTDAEDVVQETWLRWAGADRSEVRDPRAYLLTIAARLALNRLRQLRSRREEYVGPWLPEPVASPTPDIDGAAAAELADSVSMAMLVVLETLSPLERATFVLREVFDLPFAQIALALDRSDSAVRQLARRARSHVQARQPRHFVDQGRHREVTEQFLQAANRGDIEGLMSLLAPEVVLVSDGGGIKKAALRPIYGGEKIIRFLLGIMGRPDVEELTVRLGSFNGQTAIVATAGSTVDSIGFLTVEECGITAMHLVRNPDKLAGLAGMPA